MTQPPSPPHGPFPPQSGGPAASVKKPSKAPTILLIIGGIILVLGVGIGVVMAVAGIGGAMDTIDELEVHDSGSGTLTAEAGQTYQLYALQDGPTPSCAVDGPAVGPGTFQSSTITTRGSSWISVDSFTAQEAGQYSFDCSEGPVAVGPPVSIGGIFTGVGGILIAVLGGALGLGLMILGLILLLVQRSRS